MKAKSCQVTLYHRPRPVQMDEHHVWPLAAGGPNVAANRITTCGSCHEAVHSLLRAYYKAQGKPPWSVRRKYPRGVQRLAARGWALMQGAHK